ncbi:N-acetylmannosamine-6-phosphate 2-epimerase [Bacillus canaveralius]|uniref:Putative N-acetylmannosamine-6-phosphate 2-epimerase n=1 Tax=Bacillus canaveralius TaxID=1403243 RepID=A0A2N5GQK1_9BACI|nr:N-acetylmannosamine-6-phosphate 2-epimerase [Bacillus canaveralius]PLR85134.1 N-acetylmannosamine-6-phosphate 2-epimerase [Bacillus canaveralius]PLS00969.1 N-acetylmannosamine-6-phosphate 2-epimerase [Bacillus canaveralius]RSK54260.1 N-acetylmannosamine-6-phosphate 2-epimerase [Bacillus canaveralius]
MLQQVKNNLIVSCQALQDEPLHSSMIMGRMALAAQQGGAAGIRSNTKADIEEIKKTVNLPVIGIVKRNYPDSEVFITPTMPEIDEVAASGSEMAALDATNRWRPNGVKLSDLIKEVREKYPHLLLMADISTVDEAVTAEEFGFDCVSTTLIGYTNETEGQKVYENDFEILKNIVKSVKIPVIAEGSILTPEMAKRCLEVGAHSVVVGGAITRPQQITRRFTEYMKKN